MLLSLVHARQQAVVGALSLMSFVTAIHCGAFSGDNPTVSLVVGVESACVAQVKSFDVVMSTDGETDFKKHFTVMTAADLPVVVPITPTTSDETHTITVTFEIEPGQGKPPIQETLTTSVADGTTGQIVMSLACACIGKSCPSGQTCEEQPPGSGSAVCVNVLVCGDGVCNPGENHLKCANDCPLVCGDGTCSPEETCSSCEMDCGSCCGNGVCDNGESCVNCIKDCGAPVYYPIASSPDAEFPLGNPFGVCIYAATYCSTTGPLDIPPPPSPPGYTSQPSAPEGCDYNDVAGDGAPPYYQRNFCKSCNGDCAKNCP